MEHCGRPGTESGAFGRVIVSPSMPSACYTPNVQDRVPSWAFVIAALAVVVHLYFALFPLPAGAGPMKNTLGRDMASYYYAAQVAASDGDPYDVDALSAAARADNTRDEVHPYFYPPPFLIAVAWVLPLELEAAYRIGYWLDELFLIIAMLALWRWWMPLGRAVPIAIAVWAGLMFPISYGHVMGQVNGLVLALVISGLWMAESDRELPGGALIGAACMFKMSPALFVGWWLLRGRRRAAAASVGTAVALSIFALPLVDFPEQLRFYTEILPAFGSGDYNGLLVKIGMFANHSVPNVADQLIPGDGMRLSMGARVLSGGIALGLLGAAGWLFRGKATEEQIAAQVAAVCLIALLIPVYTYEHHLIFALPAMVIGSAMAWRGAFPSWAGAGIAAASMILCLPHQPLKPFAKNALGDPLGLVVQEAKFAAMVVLLAAMFRLATKARK